MATGRRFAESTIDDTLYNLLSFVKFLGESVKKEDHFTWQDVDLYIQSLSSGNGPDAGISPSQLNKLVSIQRYAKWLRLTGRLTAEELEAINNGIKSLSVEEPDEDRKFALTKQQEVGLFEAIKDWPSIYVWIVWLGLNFGLRRLELCRLKVGDIMLDGPCPMLIVRKSKGHTRKTRKLPILPSQLHQLRIILDCRKALSVSHDYLLFTPSKPEEPLNKRHLNRIFESKISRAAGIPGLNTHILRYTYAVRLWQRTRDIFLVSKALGHSSVNTTIRYLKLQDEDFFEEFLKKTAGSF